jgi:hypothetical protein
MVNHTSSVSRTPVWILVVIVLVVLVASAALIVMSHTGLIHAISSMLQGPQRMAPYGCGNSSGPC